MIPDSAPISPRPYRSWQGDGELFTANGGPGVNILMYHKVGAPLAGSRLHQSTKTLSRRVPAHLELARVVKRYARLPEPVLRWIKHLAHHKGFEMAAPDDGNFAERRRFLAAMVTHCLLYADELDVEVSDEFLAGLAADLEGVGL